MPPNNNFDKNVFINCPFDNDYKPLLRAMLFTTVVCGYEPRIASESSDSLQVRLDKISKLIEESRYSIHDISRMTAEKKDEFARFNMPFELGIDFGSRIYGGRMLSRKKSLIFDKERHRYQKALSDLAGVDIKAHKSDPDEIIYELRNWIRNDLDMVCKPGSQLCDMYKIFYGDFKQIMKQAGFQQRDIDKMSPKEFVYYVKKWKEGRDS